MGSLNRGERDKRRREQQTTEALPRLKQVADRRRARWTYTAIAKHFAFSYPNARSLVLRCVELGLLTEQEALYDGRRKRADMPGVPGDH